MASWFPRPDGAWPIDVLNSVTQIVADNETKLGELEERAKLVKIDIDDLKNRSRRNNGTIYGKRRGLWKPARFCRYKGPTGFDKK